MKTRMDLTGFTFSFQGSGHYLVYYTSPVTGKTWRRLVTDMTMIDSTKNAEYPKRKDIEHLKRYVKNSPLVIGY